MPSITLSRSFLLGLQSQYRQYLFNDFLPYMDAHIVDKKQGGFMCHTDRKGYHVSTHKRTWYDGRGIWMYAFLYQHFVQKEDYLEIAGKTIDLVLKAKPTNQVFWPTSYTQEGTPLSNKQGDIYGGLFIAEGLIAYAQASGEYSFLKRAKEILFDAVACYNSASYAYAPHYNPEELGIKAPRILGHGMALLNISRQILEIEFDAKVEELCNFCVKTLLENHLQPDFNLMIEYLNHDYSVPEGGYAQFSYTGHAIETLWMLMEEADRRGDAELFSKVADLFRRHVEVAWDDVYGGVFHCLNRVDANDWLLDKVLWAQEELMNGLMILIEKDDDWAKRWLPKVWNYLTQHFVLHDHPFKLWINGGDRKLETHHQVNRFENYHHPRHLMLNILKLKHLLSHNLG